MYRIIIFIGLFFPLLGLAQTKFSGGVKGKVLDSLTQTPLQGATLVLLDSRDSSAIAYATSDSIGLFELKNLPAGDFIFGVSFTGFAEWVKTITLSAATPLYDAGNIIMAPDTGSLAAVVVTRPPVTIKGDTVEFRASAFKTPPNATAEDLLKKLPGVEVDRDGKVTAQGEEITKIYVDGKEFFSNDPKLATKNLTADMIESIQVFDDMSDEAKFTRVDDGSRTRTINIKIKKDRRKGMFGRATASKGNSGRYSANGSLNTFNDKTQVSILGGTNNVNKAGFSQDDLQGMGRGGSNRNSSGGGNGGDGNTKTWNAGVNYRDEWGSKASFSASYFISNTDGDIKRSSYRQSFFPNDSVSNSNTETRNLNTGMNHNVNMRFEYSIDSMNSILITPSLKWSDNQTLSFDSILTTAAGKTAEYLAIAGSNRRLINSGNMGFTNNLLFRHSFAKPGRSFTIGWNTSINDNGGDGLNETPYLFYYPDSTLKRMQDIRQRYDLEGKSFNNTISTSFTESLGQGKSVELNYAFSNNQSFNDRETFDYNSNTGKFDSLNKPLTNYFENGNASSRVGGNYRVQKKKYSYQMGGAVQFATLDNLSRQALTGKDSSMQQQFINFFPNASFNYNLGKRKSLKFQYRGSTRAPNINQLQNVLDISNPIRWRVGNPDLNQEFSHNLNMSWNTFNTKTFMYFNASLQGSVIYNRIVNGIDTVSNSVQLVKPENVDGAHNFSLNSTLGIPLTKVTNGKKSPMNLNLSTNLRFNRDVSLLYKQVNFNYNYSAGQRIAFNYNIERKLDLNANLNLTYSDSRYTVQKNLNNKYLNHRYGIDATAWFFERLSINNDFEMAINGGRADGYNQSVPLWNGSVAWLLFKKSNGEIKFNVVDILNQNTSINRNVGDNYIDDSNTNILKRYYMVSFMWTLNRFGGKAMGGSQQRGGGPGQARS